jgi:lipopolysaccharide heptosyltransferase I
VKILIIRLSALGDIVHALPVLASLKRIHPQAAVDWLVEETYAPILSIAEGLHRRIVVRAARSGGAAGDPTFGGAGGYVRAVRFLRRERYDLALDLQGLIKSAVWARLSGARRVIGFDRGALREPTASWMYSETVAPREGAHVIDKNLSLLEALHQSNPGKASPQHPPVTFPLRVSATPEISGAIAAAGGARRYVVLNPGAAWPNKRWPAERFGALAAAIRDRLGLPSIITWGPSERDTADRIAAASSGAASPAPATNVGDLAALLNSAGLVVSGDTGPLHIAAALGTPIVGLYGPTWPERNGPWHPDDIVLSRADRCRCHHKRACQIGAPCIETIAVDEVVAAVTRRLGARP